MRWRVRPRCRWLAASRRCAKGRHAGRCENRARGVDWPCGIRWLVIRDLTTLIVYLRIWENHGRAVLPLCNLSFTTDIPIPPPSRYVSCNEVLDPCGFARRRQSGRGLGTMEVSGEQVAARALGSVGGLLTSPNAAPPAAHNRLDQVRVSATRDRPGREAVRSVNFPPRHAVHVADGVVPEETAATVRRGCRPCTARLHGD